MEKQQLDMINAHNSQVDIFTQKFSGDNQLIKELKKLEQFKSSAEKYMPTGVRSTSDASTLKNYLFFNFEHLDDFEKDLLIDYDRQTTKKFETQAQRLAKIDKEQEFKSYIAGRHQLNYEKLYHNIDGGYDMEKLKRVLQRTQKDIKDGLHPFIDQDEEDKLDANLRKILRLDIKAKKDKKGGEEAAKEEEASGDEDDAAKPMSEKEIIKNMF